MNEHHEHHEQGPSSLSGLSKCCGLIKNEKFNEMAAEGTLGHKVWDTGNHDLASGYPELLGLVDKLDASWSGIKHDFESKFGVIQEFRERKMSYPGINFGTMDRLVIGRGARAALIGDAKFGRWGVPDASLNLQGFNYGLYVFYAYPEVEDLWVWFGNPRREEYTLAKFKRGARIIWEREIYQIVKDAQEADPKKFRYDSVNCSFCARFDCKTRLNKSLSLMSQNPETLSIADLAQLKSHCNALRTFVDVVNKECSRRALENGEELPGYEPKEKVRRRIIKGFDNIQKALGIATEQLNTFLPISCDSELAWSAVEDAIIEFRGSKNKAQEDILSLREALEDANLLTTETYIYLAAKTNK